MGCSPWSLEELDMTERLHFLRHLMKESEVAQSCPTLCDPVNYSPSTRLLVHGILQARTPEWVAVSFSNACK